MLKGMSCGSSREWIMLTEHRIPRPRPRYPPTRPRRPRKKGQSASLRQRGRGGRQVLLIERSTRLVPAPAPAPAPTSPTLTKQISDPLPLSTSVAEKMGHGVDSSAGKSRAEKMRWYIKSSYSHTQYHPSYDLICSNSAL